MGNVHMEAKQVNYRGGATKMSVEEAIKSAIELTPEQKTNINKIPEIEADVATKTDQGVIAPEFDAEAGTYSIEDMVMHEGKLYEFTSDHSTPGDWDSTEVSEKTVSDEIDTVKSGLTNNKLGTFEDLSSYTQGQIYTCPADGYLEMHAVNGNIIMRIYGASGSAYMYSSYITSGEDSRILFLKKGMRLEVRSSSSGDNQINFIPLVN